MDVVCFDSVRDMFSASSGAPLAYDYGVCITDDASMPINIGVMTVPAHRYMAACLFLEEVLALYDFDLTFTAGQVAIAQKLQVLLTLSVLHFQRSPSLAMQHIFYSVVYHRYCYHLHSCGSSLQPPTSWPKRRSRLGTLCAMSLETCSRATRSLFSLRCGTTFARR